MSEILSPAEEDILQEVMNIGFGQASADLGEVIDIFVVLSVPQITAIRVTELPDYIRGEIRDHAHISVVEQNYLGKFRGKALLVFPPGAGGKIFSILNPENFETDNSISLTLLEKETLIEIGNILIGACVGKVSELLEDIVSYSPPRVVLDRYPADAVPLEIFDKEDTAVVMKTVFQFQGQEVDGFLFLINSSESIDWLKKALARFLESFT